MGLLLKTLDKLISINVSGNLRSRVNIFLEVDSIILWRTWQKGVLGLLFCIWIQHRRFIFLVSTHARWDSILLFLNLCHMEFSKRWEKKTKGCTIIEYLVSKLHSTPRKREIISIKIGNSNVKNKGDGRASYLLSSW